MYLGGDLSYVNEVEDNGGVFLNDGRAADLFTILCGYGANIVRVRLWHTPTWTRYSTLPDVKRTIARAKALGMAVMLDIHYSDTWADPAKQIIPAAWAQISDLGELERAVYRYTLDVLHELDGSRLTPDIVQVGNEINTEILRPEDTPGTPINWQRNARLLNAAIRAVRDASSSLSVSPQVMLHIAQPENLLLWFDDALAAGVTGFDLIGLSYYPKWSVCSIEQTAETIGAARRRYGKDVMVVETAYPWTLEPGRVDSHLIAEDCILPGYPATPAGQRQFLTDLTQAVIKHGATGVIYWEPAWISTPELPSIWENAALFDYRGEAHEGIEFLSHPYAVEARE